MKCTRPDATRRFKLRDDARRYRLARRARRKAIKGETKMKKLKVGVIGVGEVAQIIHLPILESLPELYEMVAFCDISPKLLAKMGEKYRVTNLYSNVTEMLEQSELDAVFVLNNMEYHTDCTVAALQRNIHVFVEKPMCVTEEEARAIIGARDASNSQVMVGYMRRFAPAYLRALEEVRTMGPINYARVRDIIGPNAYFTGQSGTRVYRFDDIPAEAVQDRKTRNARLMREAIGDQAPETYDAYGLLLGLNSHDISAMREMLGVPKSVKAVASSHGGRFKTAILEFDGYNAVFETGVDQQGRFDAHIEVYGERKSVLVQYDTPYLRQLPTTLRIRETIGDALEETVIRPTYKDAYTCELEYFHQVAATGMRPKTTPEDYLQDLAIFSMMMDAIK
ncbi:Gfo/Idh/MocA family protein [Cohnella abietis]|nr:Gfo/Idh/MocA family oxidoreductase [Cohnella abietis]